MQIIKNNILQSTYHERPILTDVFYKQNQLKKPIVIFCHGYKGFKDWGAWDLMATEFAKRNHFFIKFNFSHNGGTVEKPIDFPDLKAFGENNYVKELNDLENIIDWISSNNEYKNEVTTDNITLIGHSRGGGIVTIKASESKRVSNVISWCGVSDYKVRFGTKETREKWKNDGVTYIQNSRTKQQLPHFYQFYENFIENESRLNIKRACEHMKTPHLIITGENDTTVVPQEGQNMHRWNPASKIVNIQGMNHTLGAKHPWEFDELPDELAEAISESIQFIRS